MYLFFILRKHCKDNMPEERRHYVKSCFQTINLLIRYEGTGRWKKAAFHLTYVYTAVLNDSPWITL